MSLARYEEAQEMTATTWKQLVNEMVAPRFGSLRTRRTAVSFLLLASAQFCV